jgi:hypothetical protein
MHVESNEEMESKRSPLNREVMEHKIYIREERPQNSEVIDRYFDELKKVRELYISNLSQERADIADKDISACYDRLMDHIKSKYDNCQDYQDYQDDQDDLHQRIYKCKFLRDYGLRGSICYRGTLDVKRVISDKINNEQHDEFFDNCRAEIIKEIERYFPLMINFLQLERYNIEHSEILDKVFYHNRSERKDTYTWFDFLKQIKKIHNDPTQDSKVLDDFNKESNSYEITSYNRRQKSSESRNRYCNKFKVVLSDLSTSAFSIFRNVSAIVVSFQVVAVSMIFVYGQIM